jgi:hypothetical protein
MKYAQQISLFDTMGFTRLSEGIRNPADRRRQRRPEFAFQLRRKLQRRLWLNAQPVPTSRMHLWMQPTATSGDLAGLTPFSYTLFNGR